MLVVLVPLVALVTFWLHLRMFPKGWPFTPLIAVTAVTLHAGIVGIAGYAVFAVLLFDARDRLRDKVLAQRIPVAVLATAVALLVFVRLDVGLLGIPFALALMPGCLLAVVAYPLFEEQEAQNPQQPIDTILTRYAGREGYFIGHRNGRAVFLPYAIARRNGLITGAPGTGKSSIALLWLVVQMIREGRAAIVILDFKGDPATYHAVEREAGNRFIPFTLDSGKLTYTFNAFGTARQLYPEDHDAAGFICRCCSLGLGGPIYGADHFAAENYRLVTKGFEAARKRNLPLFNFNDFYVPLRTLVLDNPREYEHAGAAVTTIDLLRRLPQLYPQPGVPELYLYHALTNRKVIYCCLRAGNSPKTAGDVGRIISNAVGQIVAAARVPVALFVDEGHVWLSETSALDCEQGRQAGMVTYLSVQDLEQLRPLKGKNFGEIASALAGFKMDFTVSTGEAARNHSLLSGEKPKVVETHSRSESWKWWSWFEGSTSESTNTREIMEAVLDINTILEASSRQGAFLFRQTEDAGGTKLLGRTTIVQGVHAFTEAEYDRLNSTPWPTGPVLKTPPLDEPKRTKQPPKSGGGKPKNAEEAIDQLRRGKRKRGGDQTQ